MYKDVYNSVAYIGKNTKQLKYPKIRNVLNK